MTTSRMVPHPITGRPTINGRSLVPTVEPAGPAEELADALDRYSQLSAYTAGPDAVTATITVGGRTIRVELSAEAVETLTLAAHSMADDLTETLGGLEREYAAARTLPAPAVLRRRFTVLPGGAA